jgi:hypothetical protein
VHYLDLVAESRINNNHSMRIVVILATYRGFA